jgi:hypothetical protein
MARLWTSKATVWTKGKPKASEYCQELRSRLLNDAPSAQPEPVAPMKGAGSRDASLQAGIRGIAASAYLTLQGGQSSDSRCLAKIPLSDQLLAFAGTKRIEPAGSITFLPIFNGDIDLSKVVSPLRVRSGPPNVLCAQADTLLRLRVSLFSEGYADRLAAVAFNTDLGNQRSDNYSGILAVSSTAVGRSSEQLATHAADVFRVLVGRAWTRRGRQYEAGPLTEDALAMAQWLLKPAANTLSSLITSQERLCRQSMPSLFARPQFVKEVSAMSTSLQNGDGFSPEFYQAVHDFAKAVAAGIYFGREVNEPTHERRRDAWYNEVVALRSAPTARSFIDRAMLLVEQGHRTDSRVGTSHRGENFDPSPWLERVEQEPKYFAVFRDLFRMYLVQESTYQAASPSGANEVSAATLSEPSPAEENE